MRLKIICRLFSVCGCIELDYEIDEEVIGIKLVI